MESVTIDHVIEVLNEALLIDPEAIQSLLAIRVPCNQKLADHPTIQVMERNGKYTVGVLGLLNGIFGADENGCGYLAGEFEVICPNGHEVEDIMNTIWDHCTMCGEQLELGKLLKFVRFKK